ncbi:hypothetical protein BGZ57DRAFT_637212 [Hyaloscypha finlandica]|nr:hypothetical protein BGZ57DRAFT_637212 [Hyaloscypha finlandica]
MACERTLGLLIILPTRLFFSFMTSFIGAGKIGMSLAYSHREQWANWWALLRVFSRILDYASRTRWGVILLSCARLALGGTNQMRIKCHLNSFPCPQVMLHFCQVVRAESFHRRNFPHLNCLWESRSPII